MGMERNNGNESRSCNLSKWWHERDPTNDRIKDSQEIDLVVPFIEIKLVPDRLDHVLNDMNMT